MQSLRDCGEVVVAIKINRPYYLPLYRDDTNLVSDHACIRVEWCSSFSRR
jgi:hypothetical protein